MKPNVNITLVTVVVFCGLQAGCQSETSTPVELVTKVAERPDVTVKEMEPDDQLDKALEAFARNEDSQCAKYIKEAAKSMRLIAAGAKQKRKGAIEKAAGSLDNLAAKVEKKEITDIVHLYPTFGRAGRVLAANRLTVTETEYFTHSEKNSGAVLSKTVKQLEKSITAHHRDLNREEKQTLNDALEVANRLQKGDKVDEDDLKTTLQNIDTEIEKWNKEFEIL